MMGQRKLIFVELCESAIIITIESQLYLWKDFVSHEIVVGSVFLFGINDFSDLLHNYFKSKFRFQFEGETSKVRYF